MGEQSERRIGVLQSRVSTLETALAHLNAALHGRVRALEEALTPIASLARAYPGHPSDFVVVDLAPHVRLTVGDARRAQALLRAVEALETSETPG
jgi:hypothetical protein